MGIAETTAPAAVIVLAAGAGTRMKSRRPKVLHEIGGRSLLVHAVTAAEVRDHAAGLIAAARPALALYGPVRRGPSREALAERLAA